MKTRKFCATTCDTCAIEAGLAPAEKCENIKATKFCEREKNKKCGQKKFANKCKLTCGKCTPSADQK